MNTAYDFIVSLFTVSTEFWPLLVFVVFGGMAYLYAARSSRRGESSRLGMPTGHPIYGPAVFGMDLGRKFTGKSKAWEWIIKSFLIIALIILALQLLLLFVQ